MSTNRKWSILLRVVLALVLASLGLAGGYYLWGRDPVPDAFFVWPGSDDPLTVRDGFLSLISNARQEVLAAQMEAGDIVWLEEALASVSADASVRIITTHENATQFSRFTEMGFEIKHLDARRAPLHHKFIVVDGKTVLTGSYNWWGNTVLVTNTAVAESFQREFDYLWDLTRPSAAYELEGWYEMSCLDRLNTARFADLVEADGIEGTLALRILADRESKGRFTTVDELESRVNRIGPDRRSAILEELGCSTP